MVWGMLGLNDTVKVAGRRARKDIGKVVKVHETNHVTVEYDDGVQVTARIGDARKAKVKAPKS